MGRIEEKKDLMIFLSTVNKEINYNIRRSESYFLETMNVSQKKMLFSVHKNRIIV